MSIKTTIKHKCVYKHARWGFFASHTVAYGIDLEWLPVCASVCPCVLCVCEFTVRVYRFTAGQLSWTSALNWWLMKYRDCWWNTCFQTSADQIAPQEKKNVYKVHISIYIIISIFTIYYFYRTHWFFCPPSQPNTYADIFSHLSFLCDFKVLDIVPLLSFLTQWLSYIYSRLCIVTYILILSLLLVVKQTQLV